MSAHNRLGEALKPGTKDAKLFFHAGMIERALGDRDSARDYLARALATNPEFHPLQAPVAARALRELAGSNDETKRDEAH